MHVFGSPLEEQQTSILCVDDESDVLAELTQVLLDAGYTCHCCSDPDWALATLRDHVPDLVILDINLGAESGLKLCERIRATSGFAEVPVVFLSGAEIPNIVRRSHAAGGNYYLRKPFDPEVLLEVVDKALWMPHLAGNHHRSSSGVS